MIFFRFLLISLSIFSPFPTIQSNTPTPVKTATPPKIQEEEFAFEVHQPVRQYSKVKCLTLVLGPENKVLENAAKIIQFDLEFSDQVEIEINRHAGELDPVVLAKLYNKGMALCLYLRMQDKHTIKVELKDPASNAALFEKAFPLTENNIVYQSHCVSDALMPVLTGEKGPALSTLAYCKQISSRQKVVCIADYACKMEKVIEQARTINVAPCWHSQVPVLFYSQFTRTNSRLMSYDLRFKRHSIICSYDGLNMQPSFSPDGTQAILCLSGKGNSELYLYDQAVCKKEKKRIFQQVTNNKGNNASPCYLPDGSVVFCSDFQTGSPQIYHLKAAIGGSKKTTRLTNGHGYCAAPSYCAHTNSIVYTRYVHGFFQLFTLDLNNPQPRERQLTFTTGDKLDPSWSECGKYVAFAYTCPDTKTKKPTNQIAVANVTSGNIRILTSSKERKSFPCWTQRTAYNI